MKILIVDDEEVVRASHLRLLSGHRCYVEAALNGADALREMERDSYDLVLLDLRMPGMDGMSVLRMIKRRWPESEVVVITGYPSVDPDCVIKVAHCAIMQKKWTLHRVPTPEAEKTLYA